MTWAISFKSNFLNNLLILPSSIQNRFTEVVKYLEQDPTHNNGYTVKIKGYKLWRVKITRKYRLFFKYGDGWIQLIQIVPRNDDTYNPEFLSSMEEEEKIPAFFPPHIYEEEIISEDNSKKSQSWLSEQQLLNWRIPRKYWDSLLEIPYKNEEYLLQVLEKVEEPIYRNRILDNLCPNDYNFISKQPDFVPPDGESREFIEDFIQEQKEITDLVLKLSDEQKEILELNIEKPLLVKGGPGTGKTILAIHKAAAIAKQKHKEKGGKTKILLTSYNDSLLNYCKQLLSPLLNNYPLEYWQIEVRSIDDLASEFYQIYYKEKPKIIEKEISLSLVEEAINILNINPELDSRDLLEDFLLYIEARGLEKFEHYKQLRTGISKKDLERRWSIYEKWKELINSGGKINIETLRKEAISIVKKYEIFPYYFIILDEAQDISPVGFKFLLELVTNQNHLFFTADIKQSIYQLSYGWSHIQAALGKNIQEKTLVRSFRNTEQISKAYPDILHNQGKLTPPIPSKLQGNIPRIYLSNSIQQQVEKIKYFFEDSSHKHKLPLLRSSFILCPNTQDADLIIYFLSRYYPVQYIEPEEIDLNADYIKVLTLASCKGLEFPFVTIVGLDNGKLPRVTDQMTQNETKEIIQQEERRFYVGCSRAMKELLVCGSKSNPSRFISSLTSSRYWQREEN